MAFPIAVPRVLANVPPMYDATMIPEFKQIGNRENALASLVSSVISPLIGQRSDPREAVLHSHGRFQDSNISVE
jgi:hypothetical protein